MSTSRSRLPSVLSLPTLLTGLTLSLTTGLAACTVVQDPTSEDTAELPELPAEDLTEDPGPSEPEVSEDLAPVEDTPSGPPEVTVGPTDVILTPDAPQSDDGSADGGDTVTVDPGPELPPLDIPAMGRWRLVWEDDFNGPPCDPSVPSSCASEEDRQYALACYGTPSAPVPTTIIQSFHPSAGDPATFRREVIPHLAALDKCVWAVSDHVNSRHHVGSSGPIMRYRPSAVSIHQGELRLTTRRAAGWSAGSNDCGRRLNASGPNSEENMSANCEYDGANIVSQPLNGLGAANGQTGLASGNGRVFPTPGATHGRLEVRARLPGARGNLPIISTWPSGGGHSPEYTLVHHTIDKADTTVHGTTSYASPNASGQAQHTWAASVNDLQYEEFHTFAVAWEAGSYVSHHMNHLELDRRAHGSSLTTFGGGPQCTALSVTANPVHLMMRNLLSQYSFASAFGPTGAGHGHDSLIIDRVRWWEPCEPGDDDPSCVESTLSDTCPVPCEGIGLFEDGACFVGSPPDGTHAAATDTYLGYHRGTGLNPCPRGGLWVDGICAMIRIPKDREASVRDRRWYISPACSPTSGLLNCGQPCPLPDTYWVPEASACWYRDAIPETRPFVYANNLYYSRIDDHPNGPCPHGGNFDGANCHIGRPPDGFFAKTFGGAYYLEPNVCPAGGTWDYEQKGCRVRDFGEGSNPFLYAGGIYYRTPSPPSCPQGGTYDGANCRFRDIPVGMRAFVRGTEVYFRAPCLQSIDFAGLSSYPGDAGRVPSACD